jgi:predicted aminopeptidase
VVLTRLLETLSELEHERWSHWMLYLFGKSAYNPDGSVTIPAELVERWTRQAATPYSALSETEKESDRKEARKTLEVVPREW